jgi:predicted transcriptional regulator
MPDRSSADRLPALELAVGLLGPLEGRIMREVWQQRVVAPFPVRDVVALTPALAYTTVMTTLNRLADKGLLERNVVPTLRAHQYSPAGTPEDFLRESSQTQVDELIARFGDTAIAAFAARLDQLTPSRLRRLRALADR